LKERFEAFDDVLCQRFDVALDLFLNQLVLMVARYELSDAAGLIVYLTFPTAPSSIEMIDEVRCQGEHNRAEFHSHQS
jgi:hypothetical protein